MHKDANGQGKHCMPPRTITHDSRAGWHLNLNWTFLLSGVVFLGIQFSSSSSRIASVQREISFNQRLRAAHSNKIQRPLVVKPLLNSRNLLEVTADEYSQIHQQIQPPTSRKASTSYLLHLLRTHGIRAQLQDSQFSSGAMVLRTLTDARMGNSIGETHR